MDKLMAEALKAKEHPEIRYEMTSATPAQPGGELRWGGAEGEGGHVVLQGVGGSRAAAGGDGAVIIHQPSPYPESYGHAVHSTRPKHAAIYHGNIEAIAPLTPATAVDAGPARRATAIDALRGLFLLSMTLGFTIRPEIFPTWMYHRQFPPPGHGFRLTWLTYLALALAQPLVLAAGDAAIAVVTADTDVVAILRRLADGVGAHRGRAEDEQVDDQDEHRDDVVGDRRPHHRPEPATRVEDLPDQDEHAVEEDLGQAEAGEVDDALAGRALVAGVEVELHHPRRGHHQHVQDERHPSRPSCRPPRR